MKDHEIAKLVNDITEVARVHHGSQQLRERISRLILPVVKDSLTTAAPQPVPALVPMTLRQVADATTEFADVRSDKTIGIIRATEQFHGIKPAYTEGGAT